MELLFVAVIGLLMWNIYNMVLLHAASHRIDKLEWWVESLENRKEDRWVGEITKDVLEGDEWKHGIAGDDE